MLFIKKYFAGNDEPVDLRANFSHLYWDMVWFGVLSGSAVNFINVYATRIGATGFQIGLLGATSAVISLIFAIPAGRLLKQQGKGQAAFWSSVYYRLGFLLYIFIPVVFKAQAQVWVFIILSLIMGFPLVTLSVGFNALFADAVPPAWRAHVAGKRNVLLSVSFIITSLISGFLLERIPFPTNYQVVFIIGAIGAGISSYHLYFVHPVNYSDSAPATEAGRREIFSWRKSLGLDIWRSPFGTVLLVMLGFHLAQYLAIPVFPIAFVRKLHLGDEALGIGTAFFYLSVLIGSTQLNRMVSRLGHKQVTGVGVIAMALYPTLLAIATNEIQYYGISVLGGLAWALVGGASVNYVIENCPEQDRSAHLAWYYFILSAATLAGSLFGPLIVDALTLPMALFLFGGLRFLAGLAILKWG